MLSPARSVWPRPEWRWSVHFPPRVVVGGCAVALGERAVLFRRAAVAVEPTQNAASEVCEVQLTEDSVQLPVTVEKPLPVSA